MTDHREPAPVVATGGHHQHPAADAPPGNGERPAGLQSVSVPSGVFGPARGQYPAADAVDAVIVGFVAWLAELEMVQEQQRRCHLHAERWLRWQANRPVTALDRTEWGFYARLRRHGVGDRELAQVRAALLLRERYLRIATRTGRSRPTWQRHPAKIAIGRPGGGHNTHAGDLPPPRP